MQEKELGNEAYKKKDFEAALSHYNRYCWYCMTAMRAGTPRAPHCQTCLLCWPAGADLCPHVLVSRGTAPPAPLRLYCRAIELYDQDVSFLSNRAAAHYEKGDYEECIKDCDAGAQGLGGRARALDGGQGDVAG